FSCLFQALSRSFHHDKLLFFHIMQQYINLFAAIVVAIFIAWKKELVYRDVKQGSNEIKFVKPWVLPPVLYIHNRAWRQVYQLCKIFLCPPFCCPCFFYRYTERLKIKFSFILVHFNITLYHCTFRVMIFERSMILCLVVYNFV